MSGKFALIIGNTDYIDPGLAQLTAPGKDAEDFARVLKDIEIGAFDDVKILLNQLSSTVSESIDEFFDQKKPDDLLVLYFSGHGVRDELGALYLAVKNTIRSRLRSTAVKSDYIREVMDQSRSKRQVLILDCCNSGAVAQGTKAATGVSIGTATAFESGFGRVILTASDSTQFAWEGDKVIGETDNSLFTHYLVEGLEGEADQDGDGRITVDELYDYAYEKVRFATPKQTPSKFSSKQQGEIILRQNIRIEDTRPTPLPEDLIGAIKSSLPYVREGAVRQLELLLKGRNLSLARSARLALKKIAEEDDSRSVSQSASSVLESVRGDASITKEDQQKSLTRTAQLRREQMEQAARFKAEQDKLLREKAELEERLKEERSTREQFETERLTEEKRLALDKAEAEQKAERRAKAQAKLKAKQEVERLEAQKAEEERILRQKAEADHKAKEKAQRLATQKVVDEHIAQEKRKSLVQEASKTQKETVKKVNVKESVPVKTPWFRPATLGMVVIAIILCGFASLKYLPGIFGSPATPEYVATEPPANEAPVTEAPMATEAPVDIPTEAPPLDTSTATPPGLVFGPQDGSLEHNVDDSAIAVEYASVELRDFGVAATFLNPYSVSTGTWDYGFLFRDEYGNNQYRLIIYWNQSWALENYTEGSDYSYIQGGELPNLDIGNGGSNLIVLICDGDTGTLFVNEEYVADLDLSARQNSGDISVGTGFRNGAEINGYSTEYREFVIWEIH